MTYSTDIDALSPDHRWSFENTLNDQVGSANGTASGATLVADSTVCLDNTFKLFTNAITERVVLPSTTTISNSAQTRKAIGGWFVASGLQNPPKSIYGEGGTTTSRRIILGWGNRLVFEIDEGATILQVFGDVILEPGRPYHLFMVFEGTAYGNIFRCYLDGVLQENANPTDRVPDLANLTATTVAEFGDPAGTVAVGGTTVILLAPINGSYAQWASWDGAPAILTDTQIREELFEKGALATDTISAGTEAAMQISLDALANNVLVNDPLSIRVETVTGDGTVNLSADNITFDPLSSIHVQYMGTGTLNWTNTNGANASIGSTPNGGTINFINPANLTINGVINGAEVRIYDNEVINIGNNDTELDGIESNSGTSFVYSHDGSSNDVVIQHMAAGYEEVRQEVTLSSSDQSITLFPKVDNNI